MSKLALFGQIVQSIDRTIFNKLVKQKGTDKHSKGINSWTHFITMIFTHFSQFDSLRPICKGLQQATGNLNHLGVQNKTPAKSALSYINAHRD